MNITINEKIRNYIFMAVLGIALFILIAESSVAAEQNKVNEDNCIRYQQALSLMQNKQYNKAQILLTHLDENYRDSYQVLYNIGICSGASGDYSTAINYMEKAQQTRPALVTDQNFLVKYGEFLYKQGDYTRAKLYLLESRKYNITPEVTKEAEKYLTQIG